MSSMEAAVMARPKGRPKTGRDLVTVKIDRVLASRIRMVAKAKALTVADVISEAMRAQIDKEVAKLLRETEGKA